MLIRLAYSSLAHDIRELEKILKDISYLGGRCVWTLIASKIMLDWCKVVFTKFKKRLITATFVECR